MPPRLIPDAPSAPAIVKVYEDGPYLVHGEVEIHDQDGRQITSRRRTVALCRCGRSKLRPLCDGTHRLIRFRAPGTPEDLPAGAQDEPAARAPSPRRGRQTPLEVLRAVALAHTRVGEAMIAGADDRLRHAEPLLTAAESLLCWQLQPDSDGARSTVTDDGSSQTPEEAIRRARARAVHLTLDDPAVADQVRSLLRDAAQALSATAPPTHRGA